MTDNCAGTLVWWMVGFSVAFGDDLFAGFMGGKDGKFMFGKGMD